MTKQVAQLKYDTEYYEYLDALRDSGATNMFGGASWLQDAFDLDRTEARDILLDWMHTFSQRHPRNQP
jgi:hypothetical protein